MIIAPYFPYYERQVGGGATIHRKQYLFGGEVIAVRVTGDPVSANNGLFYRYSDHLGSTSVLGKAGASSPQSDSVARYFPFGDWRTEPAQTATNMGYTGHRHNNLAANDLGLIYMNARYYLPHLGRFLSPDTLVPDPANPQAFNRYAYVLNSPLVSTDPTGHYACHTAGSGTVFCTDFDEEPPSPQHPYRSSLLRFVGKGWTAAEQQQTHLAAAKLGGRLAATINASRLASSRAEPSLSFVSNSAAFHSALGGRVTLYRHSEGVICPYGHECRAWVGGGLPLVNLESGFSLSSHLLIHELFHIFDNLLGGAGGQAVHAAQTMPGSSFPDRPDLDGTAYDR